MDPFWHHITLAGIGLVGALLTRSDRVMSFVLLPLSAAMTIAGCVHEWGWHDTVTGLRSGEIKLSQCGRAAFRAPPAGDGGK